MKKNRKNFIIGFSLLGLFCFLCGLAYIFDIRPFGTPDLVEVTIENFPSRGSYEIDPETILLSLNEQDIDIFQPQSIFPEKYIQPKESVSWKQEDYLKVANALSQFVWKEDLRNWSLSSATFVTSCLYNQNGIASGDFEYYRETITDQGKLKYSTRVISIWPIAKSVIWGSGRLEDHPIFHWRKGIDLDKLITVEEVLQIAEDNGGQTARLSVENSCMINFYLSERLGWGVYYRDNRPGYEGSVFQIRINPYSGKVEAD